MRFRRHLALSKEERCPQCGAVILVHPNFVTWCKQCNWNSDLFGAGQIQGILESMYASMETKFGQDLFKEMVKAKSFKPTLTPSKIVAFVMALIVHGFTLLIAVIGLWLLAVGLSNLFAMCGAVVLLLLCWFLRPRFPKMVGKIIPRDQMPTLYRLVDEIAQALETSSVDGIVINAQFGSAFAQVGWQRKKILYIGLPLFSILDAQERVAFVAHELAHSINGDPMRGLVLGSTANTLVKWHRVLYPDSTRVFDIDKILIIPINIIRLVLSGIAWLGTFVMVLLLWRNSQRAEYLADWLAVNVSGTDAMLSLLHKLYFRAAYEQAIREVALGSESLDFFDVLAQKIAKIPKQELERSQVSRLDTTHPPTIYRIELIKRSKIGPRTLLSPHDMAQLEQELASVRGNAQYVLVDEYMARISR